MQLSAAQSRHLAQRFVPGRRCASAPRPCDRSLAARPGSYYGDGLRRHAARQPHPEAGHNPADQEIIGRNQVAAARLRPDRSRLEPAFRWPGDHE